MKRRVFALGLFSILLATAPASAQTVAYTYTGGTAVTNSNFTLGFRFTTSAPLTVTSLGWFDQGSDGLGFAHPVGIWSTSAQTLMVSGTVPSGTAGTLV